MTKLNKEIIVFKSKGCTFSDFVVDDLVIINLKWLKRLN